MDLHFSDTCISVHPQYDEREGYLSLPVKLVIEGESEFDKLLRQEFRISKIKTMEKCTTFIYFLKCINGMRSLINDWNKATSL